MLHGTFIIHDESYHTCHMAFSPVINGGLAVAVVQDDSAPGPKPTLPKPCDHPYHTYIKNVKKIRQRPIARSFVWGGIFKEESVLLTQLSVSTVEPSGD